jgi:predicted alpha/beta-fold hydrolase
MAGKLKDTNRYKEADKMLKKSKEKYNPSSVTVTGHSLGSAISSNISSKSDKVLTLDGAYTIGQKTRNNTTAYRTRGDVVSLLGKNATHMKTLKNTHYSNGIINDILNAHDIKNIQKEKIFV